MMFFMPSTPIPDNYGVASAIVELTSSGERMTTTFGFHNTHLDDAITNASLISGKWMDNFTIGSLTDSYTYVGVYVIESIGGVLQSAQTSDSLVGTVHDDPPSPAVSCGITKQTSYAGKKYRGRMYLPAGYMVESEINEGGKLSDAQFGSIVTQATGLLADLDSAGVPMYLLHRDATVPTPVNDLLVRQLVRTQRRRQRLS